MVQPKGIEHGSRLRTAINQCESVPALRALVTQFFFEGSYALAASGLDAEHLHHAHQPRIELRRPRDEDFERREHEQPRQRALVRGPRGEQHRRVQHHAVADADGAVDQHELLDAQHSRHRRERQRHQAPELEPRHHQHGEEIAGQVDHAERSVARD